MAQPQAKPPKKMYFLYFSHLYMYRPTEKTIAPNSKVILIIFTTPQCTSQIIMSSMAYATCLFSCPSVATIKLFNKYNHPRNTNIVSVLHNICKIMFTEVNNVKKKNEKSTFVLHGIHTGLHIYIIIFKFIFIFKFNQNTRNAMKCNFISDNDISIFNYRE